MNDTQSEAFMNRKSTGRPAASPSAQQPPSQQRPPSGSSSVATAVWLLLLSCLIGAALLGCKPPPRPEFKEISRTAPGEASTDAAEEALDRAPAMQPFTEPWETWQSYHIANRHIGYSHVQAKPQSDDPDSPIEIVLQDQVLLRRGPATIVQRLDQTSLETRTGELLSFEAELRIGPALTRYEGTVDGDTLTVVTTRGSKKSSQSIPWSPNYRGLVGLQQALFSDPPEIGEKRRLRTLLPVQYAVATIEINCQHTASIALPDGSVQTARELEVAMQLGDGPVMQTLVWIDDAGNVLKSYTPGLELVAFNSTGEAATAGIVAGGDILTATAVEVSGNLTDPTKAQRVGYLVTPRNSRGDTDAEYGFQAQPGQWSRKTPEGAFQVLVSRDPQQRVGDSFTTSNLTPGPEDSRPGPLIDSNGTLVKRLAAASTAPKDQPLRLALDLTQTVKSLIRRTDYAQGFRAASEIAREGSGDCTARSILLAAMLRSRNIPARVAVGLVYMPAEDQPRMVYHMWTIAYIDGRWVHLDATLTGGYAPADRVTLGTHHLADGNEYECVAPILGIIGQVDIAILNATYEN